MSDLIPFHQIFGVDFSGAKLAGRNTWIARLAVSASGRLRLTHLDPLERLTADPSRAIALAHLVDLIAQSENALWALDFPFALPVEILPRHHTFDDQLRMVSRWKHDANAFGRHCVDRTVRYNARRPLGPAAPKFHIRRLTDFETKTPFDCYHYRIIYQTFHGMRDVLLPLRAHRHTALLPFDYARLRRAKNVVVESCPGSFLRRARWPHNNYKQPQGGPLTPIRLRNRRQILAHLEQHVAITPQQRRVMMRNPGADALDAVLAAYAAAIRYPEQDHRAIARHPRYPREGHVYS